MTYAEAAKGLGITEAEYRRYAVAYLNCEGCTDDGTEYDDLHGYIQAIRNPRPAARAALVGDGTPWQKGDNNPG